MMIANEAFVKTTFEGIYLILYFVILLFWLQLPQQALGVSVKE